MTLNFAPANTAALLCRVTYLPSPGGDPVTTHYRDLREGMLSALSLMGDPVDAVTEAMDLPALELYADEIAARSNTDAAVAWDFIPDPLAEPDTRTLAAILVAAARVIAQPETPLFDRMTDVIIDLSSTAPASTASLPALTRYNLNTSAARALHGRLEDNLRDMLAALSAEAAAK
jgi:hypothetical protein